MSAIWQEFTHAGRMLRSQPAFSILVVAVLAAGLACVIFMLAMLNGFVIRPLPFAQPEQLLHAGVREDGGNDLNPVRGAELIDVRRQLVDVAETAGFARSSINLSDLENAERISGAFVSANLFRVLGIAPLQGRDFSGDDARPGAPAVAMLSWSLWQSRYGGDPGIVGREVRINAKPATVIGVMPEGFSYPNNEVVWLAGHLADNAPADDLSWWVVLRRHTDAGDAEVSAAFDNWFAQAAHGDPERFRAMQPGIEPLAYLAVAKTTRVVLGIMLAAVLMVLLVACANAANLMLTRTLGRRQELAVRMALGASRRRLAVHLLIECLLLSLIATAIAFPLAMAGMSWQQSLMHQADFGPPRWLRFDMDNTVIGLSLAAALATALLTGILAAWRVGAEGISTRLRDGTRSVAGGSFARVSRLLVIGEVALSCALLICVGTMVRGLSALDHVDLGFDATHLLTARIVLPISAYPTATDQAKLYERLADQLRADPGVVNATVGTVLPGANASDIHSVVAEGSVVGDGALPLSNYGAVDDQFLSAYGLRLQQGRFFDARDGVDGTRVAVVDQRFAERFGAGASVLGQRFRLDPRDPKGATVTVVGVIGALKLDAPADAAKPALLVPMRQDAFRVASVTVRTQGEPLAFAPRLAAIMHSVDADTPLYWVRNFSGVIDSGTLGERMVAQSFSAFGILALLLAGAGLYGVVTFGVSQRTREIGVRRALGSPNRQVLRTLFTRTLVQLGIGLAVGLALGIPFARLLTGSMHGIETGSASVVLGAVGVLAIAALLAVMVPARRALRVDPMVALRHD